MFDYEEACPVSKAASILCERWTLQILREMFLGATRFSEFQRYLPKMSPSLLKTRLRRLEENGVIVRRSVPEKRSAEYRLTPTGIALKPVIAELGKWGMRWAFDSLSESELNVHSLVRDFAVALKRDQLPEGNYFIQMSVIDADCTHVRYLSVRDDGVQVCDESMGCEVNLYLTANLKTWGRIWYGDVSVVAAVQQQQLKAMGDPWLVKHLSQWIGLSQFSSCHERLFD